MPKPLFKSDIKKLEKVKKSLEKYRRKKGLPLVENDYFDKGIQQLRRTVFYLNQIT